MSTRAAFSVLDLAPIIQGGTARDAFLRAAELAQHCEQLGFSRYWLAEHHGMPGIASAATSILISHVASQTQRIRVGAGGIMLPNHSPLVIAEQFATLESLYPGRIDLGLGRAPGSDQITSRALRRDLNSDPEQFPRDVLELMDYMSDEPEQPVLAVPGKGSKVPVWILGSSLYGAQLAAALGLPYAFASHFAPAQLAHACEVYRQHFRPSKYLDKPYLMLGFNIFAADTTAEAEDLATSWQQSFVSLRSGKPITLPPPAPGYMDNASPQAQELIKHMMHCTAIGDVDTVRQKIHATLVNTQANELIVTSNIYDQKARLHSYTLAAEAFTSL